MNCRLFIDKGIKIIIVEKNISFFFILMYKNINGLLFLIVIKLYS